LDGHLDDHLIIRRLDRMDAAACAALHATGFLHPWAEAEFESLLLAPEVCGDGLFLPDAMGQSVLIGFVLSRHAADEAEILTIVMAPSHRGRGHSNALLEAHIEAVAHIGATCLFLEVDVDNAPARALYSRHGFEKVGERKGYYRKPDGSRSTALVLRRNFVSAPHSGKSK